MKIYFFLLAVALFFHQPVSAHHDDGKNFDHNNTIETIHIRGPQSEFDASFDYFEGLIKLAFKKQHIQVKLKYAPFMTQQRALSELEHGTHLDLYWAGSDSVRQERLGFVNVPLVKGLLGFRVFITHKNNEMRLIQAKQLADIKPLTLCQGSHWPDTDILLAAKLEVLTNTVYENMFKQVNSKRCHAFPRGINEAQAEFDARKLIMPDLRLVQQTILYYPFPMYFFTNKENTRLITIIKNGLELAIDDGSFDDYIENHPTTKHLFPVENWNNVNYIKLNNPFLPNNTNINNPRYWILPPESN